MTVFDQISTRIIQEQEAIIGPLAWSEAEKVRGIHVLDKSKGEVSVANGDNRIVIDNLVHQYEHIFGRASREVCREAVASLVADLSPSEVPSSLR